MAGILSFPGRNEFPKVTRQTPRLHGGLHSSPPPPDSNKSAISGTWCRDIQLMACCRENATPISLLLTNICLGRLHLTWIGFAWCMVFLSWWSKKISTITLNPMWALLWHSWLLLHLHNKFARIKRQVLPYVFLLMLLGICINFLSFFRNVCFSQDSDSAG